MGPFSTFNMSFQKSRGSYLDSGQIGITGKTLELFYDKNFHVLDYDLQNRNYFSYALLPLGLNF